MSVYEVEETPTLGFVKVKVLTAVANPEAVSLATEVNAVSSKDVTLTFRDWNPTVNVNSGTAPKKLGTRNQYPQEGLAQYQPIEVRYPYDPQADDTDPNNQGKATMTPGTIREVLVRRGLDALDVDFAVDDKYELWSVRCGRQTRTKSGDDEFASEEIVQMLYPIKEEAYGAIVA